MNQICIFFGNYFTKLFTVETGDGEYAYLPYLMTAVAIGIVFAAIYFTFWRAQESKLLKRLKKAGAVGQDAGVPLSELGYRPGALNTRITCLALRSPACILYRNASTKEVDALKVALENAGKASEADAGVSSGASANPEGSLPEENPARLRHAEAKRRRKMGLRLAVTPDTVFYIREERLSYVEEKAEKFSLDDYMGLLYTAALVALVWFLLMNFLDAILGLFVG